MQGRDEVYSEKIRAGKRTYFFDVRSTRSNDYYITITESKRRFNGRGYDKHKIFLYKEDFNKFLASLNKTVDHVKNELMPDYDYDEFDRREMDYDDDDDDDRRDRVDYEGDADGEIESLPSWEE
ncbi:MAG: DUF3276 family protein [Bacteroidia bacterium]